MLVNKSTLTAVFTNLKTSFNRAFSNATTVYQRIAMVVPSSGSENTYVWLSKFPKMRKWIGEKAFKSLSAHKYTIVNDDYEVTVEVERNDVEDDQLGIYGPQAEMAGDSAAMLPEEITAEVINGGFTNTCFDGQYFFDTDHEVDGASVSNKGVAVLSAATLAAAQASFGTAKTAMTSFKDDEGRSLNVRPDVLLVPPALEDTARALMTVERLEDGKPNIYKGACEVVVMQGLTSDTAWFLLDTRKPVRPFIVQQRKKPEFVSMTDMASEIVFTLKKYLFGAEARMAGGYGFWQLAYGSTGQG